MFPTVAQEIGPADVGQRQRACWLRSESILKLQRKYLTC